MRGNSRLLASSARGATCFFGAGCGIELREKPLIENAVEKIHRPGTPVVFWYRSTTRRAEVASVGVPEGARLVLLMTLTDRAERVFKSPGGFDIYCEDAGCLYLGIAFSRRTHPVLP